MLDRKKNLTCCLVSAVLGNRRTVFVSESINLRGEFGCGPADEGFYLPSGRCIKGQLQSRGGSLGMGTEVRREAETERGEALKGGDC